MSATSLEACLIGRATGEPAASPTSLEATNHSVVKVALVLKIGDAIHHGAPRKKRRDTELVDFQYDGAVGWGVLRGAPTSRTNERFSG